MWFATGKGRFSDPKHVRRARAYLEEARMAMLEHSIAAEHYKAMTTMYAQRVRRLEQEIGEWDAQYTGARGAPSAVTSAAPVADESVADAEPVISGGRTWPQTGGVVMPLASADVPPDPAGRRQAA